MISQILIFLGLLGYTIDEDQFLKYEHTSTDSKAIVSVNVKFKDMKKLNTALKDERYEKTIRDVFAAGIESIVPDYNKSEYIFTFRF